MSDDIEAETEAEYEDYHDDHEVVYVNEYLFYHVDQPCQLVKESQEIGEPCELTKHIDDLAVAEHFCIELKGIWLYSVLHDYVDVVCKNENVHNHHGQINPGIDPLEKGPF